ncbi:unnamed protein product [Rotaria socialis]|uniref:Protein bicaudal D n=2 Tax=Rotaria socialis TaxID=392032 RepID=A0A820ICH8_9BILA|nr:unnamed protein product [Rotaria socialis]CAF3439782.1 unnamed protein product [Rotaria socialis]CAF3452258.1 unnamed protein product [Rotaria socialis]CAF3525754.1 unnamed protein product [Rotaria socialis]CAF3547445.1 unnamed protein product [Rotaria socialis]
MTTTEDEDPYIQIAKLHSANLQAAEYGLALIDEKKVLELQHKELENEHELLKLEFEQLKTQLKTLQVNKREATLKGETNEETLLHEKLAREKYLTEEIVRHEHELRLLKHDNERLHTENEKFSVNCQELTERIHEFDELKVKLKYELKETKAQEQRLIDANTELEEDNVALQQQVQKLRENLVDFDGLKHENKQLQENIDDLHRMMKELESLKAIAESQLIELHNSLRDEREQKHIYKQQLDHRIQQESRRNLDSLRMTLNGHSSTHTDDDYLIEGDDDIEDDDTSRVPSSTEYSDTFENDQQEQQPVGNLFSEIHGNEIRKLELECLQLSQIKSSLDNQLLTINEKTKILSHKIQHLMDIVIPNKQLSTESNSDDTDNLLVKALESIEQIDSIVHKNLHLFNGDQDLLKKKSDEQENFIIKLKQDNNILMKQCNDSQTLFSKTHDNLMALSEELETLHKYIYTSNGLSTSMNDFEIRKQQLLNSNNKIIDPLINQQLLEILQEQVKQLKQSFDHILSKTKQQSRDQSSNIENIPPTNELPNDTKELQDQIIKIRSLLTTKREQIGTLRTVLKANKQTAEVALANLKSKYENEKLIVTETMSKLRNELKSLKEDAATFASLRAMFAARCDEYVTQLDELQRQVHAAEEEKKTLNSLLRMAIEQKLALTQKLEDLEMDNERAHTTVSVSKRSNNLNNNPSSATATSPVSSGPTLGLSTTASINNTNINHNISNNGPIQELRRGRFIPPRVRQQKSFPNTSPQTPTSSKWGH